MQNLRFGRACKGFFNSRPQNINIKDTVLNYCVYFTTTPILNEEKKSDDDTSKPKTKKGNHITLIGTEGVPSTSNLEAALKLSKRRDLKLIKVHDFDPRRQTPVYKLISGAQVLKDDITLKKLKTKKQTSKIISFSHNISQHDLDSKVQMIIKWLGKRFDVRATISGPTVDNTQVERAYVRIEDLITPHGRLVQKNITGTDIKFQVIPLKEDNKNSKGKSET